MASPWLRPLVKVFWTHWSTFDSTSVNVRIVADKVTHCDGFSPQYFGFTLSVSFQDCSILIFFEMFLVRKKHRGGIAAPASKQIFFRCRQILRRNFISLSVFKGVILSACLIRTDGGQSFFFLLFFVFSSRTVFITCCTFEGSLTVHLYHEIKWNANLMQQCIYWSFLSSTYFGRIRPSSGALDVKVAAYGFLHTQRLSGPPPIYKLDAENHMLQL